MGSAWLAMALPCLIVPSFVLKLSVNPALLTDQPGKHENKLDCFILRCFGSQAVLVSILLLNCDMNKDTYKIWTVSMVPFFVFDFVAFKSGYLTLLGAVGDGLGNVIFTLCSAVGAGLLQ